MRKSILPLLLLCASCSSAPDQASPHEAAISSYIKSTLGKPESYSPVRFSAPVAYTQQSENELQAAKLRSQNDSLRERSKVLYDLAKAEARGGDDNQMRKTAAEANRVMDMQQAMLRKEDSLLKAADTTRLGIVFMHAYRAENKQGGMSLDSAKFLVLPTGTVRVVP